MDARHFDAVTRLFAGSRRSRRRALAEAGTGLAAGVLAAAGLTAPARAQDQDAAPSGHPDSPPAGGESGTDDGPAFLFVQSFQAGSVAAKDGAGRYTLTLEAGLGQTVYFSDRPERIVGAAPTPQFLAGLGFPDDNPPNAALVVETASGETEIAVLQLYSPVYDEASRTATYEVAVLAEWERTSEANFAETTVELDQLLPEFGAAHLFIDDCPDAVVTCHGGLGSGDLGQIGLGYCWDWAGACCKPCDPNWYTTKSNECNLTFEGCAAEGCWASKNNPDYSCSGY